MAGEYRLTVISDSIWIVQQNHLTYEFFHPKIKNLNSTEIQYVFFNLNNYDNYSIEDHLPERTDDWLLWLLLQNTQLKEIVFGNQQQTGPTMNDQNIFEGLMKLMQMILMYLTNNAFESFKSPLSLMSKSSTHDETVNHNYSPAHDSKQLSSSAETADTLQEVFPVSLLLHSTLSIHYTEDDAVLCLEWLCRLVTSSTSRMGGDAAMNGDCAGNAHDNGKEEKNHLDRERRLDKFVGK